MPHFLPMLRMSDTSSASMEKTFASDLEFLNKVMKDEWELCPTDITISDMLGEGAFGEVYKGHLKGPIANPRIKPEYRNSLHIPVAIKLLKDTTKGSERRDFISEMDMMKKVSEGHNPHVVSMLGCVATQEPLCLVTEFVEYGDLLTYLRSSRQMYVTGIAGNGSDPYVQLGKLKPMDLPSFSYQIAAGMAYLSDIGIVHRDLACRNVLVGIDKALKITDFGLSRETEDMYIQKSNGRVPYKWMALESILAREFTSASDVWSYGIVLWEIGTIGGVPYPLVNNADLVPYLKAGNRMKIPDGCPNNIYDIMQSCWTEDPSKRPSFSDLTTKFNDILLSLKPESYVDFKNINLEQSCYQDDDFNLDFTEEENDLPMEKNFLDVLGVTDRRISLPVPTTQNLLDHRRASSPTTKTEITEPKRFNLLDKIKKSKWFSFEEDNQASSNAEDVSISNLNLSLESLNRYVTSPTSVIMDEKLFTFGKEACNNP